MFDIFPNLEDDYKILLFYVNLLTYAELSGEKNNYSTNIIYALITHSIYAILMSIKALFNHSMNFA